MANVFALVINLIIVSVVVVIPIPLCGAALWRRKAE
ncbi:MAG: IlvGEDA operon leader peptide [Arsenophonus endosymbiont of Dermacentor nuttalli]